MLEVALIHAVFPPPEGPRRLAEVLARARARGATLALLPELPLDPWVPATGDRRPEHAEPPGGGRHQLLAAAAREASIGLVGGAIVRDPGSGRRHNTALVFDAHGTLVASYKKAHLPQEPGFLERDHYEPGDEPAEPIDAFGMPLGIQICSDANRPQGSHLLAALGAEAVLVPRATERATWERWRRVLRANALVTGAYVLSVNRPGPEAGVGIGGPSLALSPDGEVLWESEDELCLVRLERSAVERARRAYPGYLTWSAELYRAGWERVAARRDVRAGRA